jgi:uncharacterized membrane protein
MSTRAHTRHELTEKVVPDAIAAPRTVAFDAPWDWLASGWRDLWQSPGISLTYGAAFALGAAIIAYGLWLFNAHAVFLALAGGFMIIGPFVAVGLYEISRSHGAGRRASFGDAILAGSRARGQLWFFGAGLMFALMAWLQIALLLFMLFFGTTGMPPADRFVHMLLFSPRGLGLLVVGTAVGAVIAGAVYALSVVAVPLLLERQVDAVSAARASFAAVLRNPKAMALWAALIVVMMAAGFATLLVGLVFAFPLIGHATWHAYQDLFGEAGRAPDGGPRS